MVGRLLPRLSRCDAREGRSRGQALVEFAFVLPVFLFMLFGLLDMGRLVYMHSTLSQAAREAARLVSVEAYWIGRGTPGPTFDPSCNQPGGPVCPADVAALTADALAAANRMMTPFGSIPSASLFVSCDASAPPSGAWTTQTCNSTSTGSVASIRVTLEFRPATPVISHMFPSVSTDASATMVIN